MKFANKKPNTQKLLSFGFTGSDHNFYYQTDLANGQMKLSVTVRDDGNVSTIVTDSTNGEEYVLHRVAVATGSFVAQIKSEYETVLDEIAEKCFDPEVFKSEQAKAVINYARDSYGDELEYLWQKFPNNAIVRRKDNRKWYAAILTVSRRKLGFDSDEIVEILDLRSKQEEGESTIDHIKYFPGYHMNKKHWITICLDGTVSNEEIFTRIDHSYNLAKK